MRRFLIKASYLILPLWLITVGLVFYYTQIVVPNIDGELGPLGKIMFPKENKANVSINEFYYTDILNLQELADTTVDVLTLGDSFSQQWKGSYENFIARDGLSVINFHVAMNMFQATYDLMHLGYIDSMRVKTIVIESGERYLTERILGLKTTNKEVMIKPIELVAAYGENGLPQSTPLIETRNFILLRLGIKHPVRHVRVNRDFFTQGMSRELYFLDEDLDYPSILATDTATIKHNITTLNSLADSLGIQLVYIVPPDKYSIYQHYIVNNPFPEKTVGRDIKKILGNDPLHPWVMAEDIIEPLLKAGERDVYPLSSSHWSWSTAERVASVVRDTILKAQASRHILTQEK